MAKYFNCSPRDILELEEADFLDYLKIINCQNVLNQ